MSVLWHYPYELQPRGALNARAGRSPRRGALIRIDGGYADLHPWPEFGDMPLDEELRGLKEGRPGKLGQRALFFAQTDAEARREDRNLLENLAIPSNHYFISDFSIFDTPQALDKLLSQLTDRGFERVKVKMGRDLAADEAHLKILLGLLNGTSIKLRLDFNANLTEASFRSFWKRWQDETLDRIDYVEDPVAFDSGLWERLSAELGCRLALDLAPTQIKCSDDPRDDKGTPPFAVAIVKPAAEDPWPVVESAARNMRRLVFTSYMDHPLGQVAAAWSASLVAEKHPLLVDTCGFLSHSAYEKTVFSEQLKVLGPRLFPVTGTGFGFNEVLESLSWKKV